MEMTTSGQYQERLKDRYEIAVAECSDLYPAASDAWKANYIKWYCYAQDFVTYQEWLEL